MNGTEQRVHRTVTRDLQSQLTDLIDVVTAIDAQQAKLWGDTVEAIAAERVHRHQMRETLRAAIDDERTARLAMTADRDRRIADWEALTLWQRLRWMLRGTAR